MSVAFGASGGAVSGTSSIALGYPTGITAGQLLLMVVAWGNGSTTRPATPTGWDHAGTVAGGAGAWGSGTGPRGVTYFTRQAGGTESGTVTVNNGGGTGQVLRGVIHRYTKTLTYWAAVEVTGSADTTADTSWSTPSPSDPGGAAGMRRHIANALATTGTPSMSSVSSTWPGLTTTRTVMGVGTATGGYGVRLMEFRDALDSGASTGAPTFTATLSAAAGGAGASAILADTVTDPNPPAPPTPAVKVWDGTAWVPGTRHVWDGTAWV